MKKVEVSESALESIKAMAAQLYEENEELRAAIEESLRMVGNWPEGAQAVLEDALAKIKR